MAALGGRAFGGPRGKEGQVKRLLAAGLLAVVIFTLTRGIRERIPKLMERMIEDVMPNMMDSCFAQMDPDRRKFMLAHCRGMLDRVEEKYVRAEAA